MTAMRRGFIERRGASPATTSFVCLHKVVASTAWPLEKFGKFINGNINK